MPAYNNDETNWQDAGLAKIGGLAANEPTTQCGATVNPSGITPPASGDDASLINTAISNCTAGDYVLLGAGTFNFDTSEIILIDKSVVLRGSGAGTTILQVYNGLLESWLDGGQCGVSLPGTVSNCSGSGTPTVVIGPANSLYDYGWSSCALPGSSPGTCTGIAFSADAAQGDTSISVASTTGLVVGGVVLMDEAMNSVQISNPVTACGDQVWAESDATSANGSPADGRFIWPTSTCVSDNGGTANPNSFSSFLCSYGQNYCDRPNAELHIVTSIGAGPCPCSVGLDSPLTDAFRASGSHDAQVYLPTHQLSSTALPFLQKAGIENLTITRCASGCIDLKFCEYCWVKNIEAVGWADGTVNLIYTLRSEVTGSYLHQGWDLEPSGAEYILSVNNASTENLIDNNILTEGGKGMVGRNGAANVIAYNYQDDQLYMGDSVGSSWEDVGTGQSHWTGSHHDLFEGNWSSNCDNDDTWGSDIYQMYFRNQCTGVRSTFTDPSMNKTVDDATGTAWKCGAFTGSTTSGSSALSWSSGFALAAGDIVVSPGTAPPGIAISSGSGSSWTLAANATQTQTNVTLNGCEPSAPGPLRPAGLMAWMYWEAYVGNVLGLSGVTTSANNWQYSASNWAAGQTGSIWLVGWNAITNTDTDPNLTGATPYFFRHANYDYETASIADYAAGYSHALPNSVFLSSAPAYFTGAHCTYAWPGVTPNGSSPLQTPTGTGCTSSDWNPAKARFDAGTPFAQP